MMGSGEISETKPGGAVEFRETRRDWRDASKAKCDDEDDDDRAKNTQQKYARAKSAARRSKEKDRGEHRTCVVEG
jgi:hypothetical protein